MKGKARAQSIAVYARLMRVRVASSPDFPKCCAGTCVLGVGVGPSSPHQSVLRTALQNHNTPPPLVLDNKHQICPRIVSETSIALNRIPSAGAILSGCLQFLSALSQKKPGRKSAGRQLFLFLPGGLNIHNRATWRRVHPRNGAPMRKARLFTTWVSGAGEMIQDPK